MSNGIRICMYAAGAVLFLTLAACSGEQEGAAAEDRNLEETQGIVLLRGLPTLGTSDAVAIVELDPEAENFGEILEEFEFPGYDAPLHHLYYSPNGRLYTISTTVPTVGSMPRV
jgi:hypothetical protein